MKSHRITLLAEWLQAVWMLAYGKQSFYGCPNFDRVPAQSNLRSLSLCAPAKPEPPWQ